MLFIHSFSRNENSHEREWEFSLERVMWPLNSVANHINQLSGNVCVFLGIQCSKFYTALHGYKQTAKIG